MRVCLLNDSFPPVIDGVANVVLNYARIMTEENLAEVTVGTPRYPDAEYDSYPYTVIPYQSFDTSGIVNGYRTGNPLSLKEVVDLSNPRPDIIHTHCPAISTYVARMVRAKTDAPIIFTYHTKFDEDIARAMRSELMQKETLRLLVNNISACDEVWCVSRGAGENMRSLGYEGDYRVVNNGVDFAKGRVDTESVAKVTADYDLPEDVPVYIYVGRMIAYKGIPFILEALKKLDHDGQDFRMIFVGNGPDAEKFRHTAEEYGLLNRKIFFTGAIYERDVLRAWNTRADLFLFPSTYDTNGIVVREAAACGLASVLVAGSCAAEGITDGRNGFFIEQNAESLYRLLVRLGNDRETMHTVGAHAMEEIYISWEDSVHAACERYHELTDLKRSGMLAKKQHTMAEYFANLPDEIAIEIHRFFQRPGRMFDNMLDNVEVFTQEMKAEIQKRLRSLH